MHRVGDEVGLGVGDYTDTAERETFIAEKVRNKLFEGTDRWTVRFC